MGKKVTTKEYNNNLVKIPLVVEIKETNWAFDKKKRKRERD